MQENAHTADKEALNSYMIRYSTIDDNGIIDISIIKEEIKAVNQQDACDLLQKKISSSKHIKIRIHKVERLLLQVKEQKKKKQSIGVWIFFLLFGLIVLSRVIDRLIY